MGISAEAARDIVVSLCGRLSTHLDGLDPASDRVDPSDRGLEEANRDHRRLTAGW